MVDLKYNSPLMKKDWLMVLNIRRMENRFITTAHVAVPCNCGV